MAIHPRVTTRGTEPGLQAVWHFSYFIQHLRARRARYSGRFSKRTLHEHNVAAISSDAALTEIVVAPEVFSEFTRNRPVNSFLTHKNYLSSR
jgi:hypothetical protein